MDANECGISSVNIVPRGNNVLLRMNFKASILALSSGKPEENSNEKVIFTVAGFGPLVKDLVLGEEVLFKLHAAYDDIPVKGNNQSIKDLTDFYGKLPKGEVSKMVMAGNNKADAIQYGMFPEFQIVGHIK